MPAIASAVRKSGARFYWHLGDYRAIYDFDGDMVAPPALQLNQPHLTISSYLSTAWPDFIKIQLPPSATSRSSSPSATTKPSLPRTTLPSWPSSGFISTRLLSTPSAG